MVREKEILGGGGARFSPGGGAVEVRVGGRAHLAHLPRSPDLGGSSPPHTSNPAGAKTPSGPRACSTERSPLVNDNPTTQ